ncbi:MAG: circadian clock KaiB family protein [Candidatus Competibacteraceae bacterium]
MTDHPVDTQDVPAEATGEKFVLRLYVAGNSPQSTRAIERAKAFCESHLKGRYELTVVDLYQHPEATQNEQIIAAPTLVKTLPPPLRQLIGDLSNTSRLLLALDIDLGTE